ncbi:MAG: molybdopterin-guanine dinucleotide biosynthesis protein B [Desulfobacteraceae bacterium]|jgi:molybdopterin-guanine dinucleotide biosynthesis protein B
MKSKPRFKLQSCQRIVDQNNRIVMAEGRMMLLEKIVETGSINQAAKLMRMSYKSAWSKIRSTERHFQMKIVHSDKAHGTQLTEAGRDLLAKYKQIKKLCLEADDAAFEASFYPAQEHKAAVSPSRGGHIPILSFVGHSGSGKTTIIEKVIANLTAAGLKVAIVKHDVHGFEMDRPGKDSWRHKQAGAVATIVSSPSKIGLVMDSDHDHCPEALAHLIEFADLILTEGYKKEPHPKIEVFRPHATGDDKPLCQDDPALLAIVSDEAIESRVPIFGTSDIEGLAAFIKSWLEVDSHLGSG